MLANFIAMSFLFSICHGVVVTVFAIAPAIVGADNGSTSLAVFNATYVLTGLALQGPVVQCLGLKNSLVVGCMLYCIYVISFTLATLAVGSTTKYIFTVAGAVVGGFAAGFLWTAQGSYLSAASSHRAAMWKGTAVEQKANQQSSNFLSGIFAVIYLSVELATKVYSSVIMSRTASEEFENSVVLEHFSVIAAASAVCLYWAKDYDLDHGHGDTDGCRCKWGEISGVVDLMCSDAKCMLLLVPTCVTFGLASSTLNGSVGASVSARPDMGKQTIGFLTAISTAVAAIASLLFSASTSCPRGCSQLSPMLWACTAYFCFGLLLMLVPTLSTSMESDGSNFGVPAIVSLYVLQGVGRGFFESTFKAIVVDTFPKSRTQPAFANIVVWSGFSMSAGYASLVFVSEQEMGAVLVGMSAVAACFACYSLYGFGSRVAERQSAEEEEQSLLP